MSCEVKELLSPSPSSRSSSFKVWVLLILMSVLLSVFRKATLTSPMSFTPGPQCYRYYGEG